MLFGRKLLSIVFLATISACTLAQDSPRLKESDVLKLIELQPKDSVIVRRLLASKLEFKVDASSLARFKGAGASESVLAALVGSEPAVRYESYDNKTGGALTVEGTGTSKFSLQDSEGMEVASGSTGAKKPVVVPPGTYQLLLNGFARPLVVKAGKRAVVATGEVCVLSSGGAKGSWMWRLPGQKYANAWTASHGRSVELLVGDWDVLPGDCFYHNLAERRITVRPGRKLTLKTGAIKARGSSGIWSVYIGEQELTNGQLRFGVVRHFFPGQYDVWHLLARTGPMSSGSVKIATVKVKAGELTEVKSPY